MKDIHVLILAGGDSTRFWPLGDKLFLNFLGKPILFYRLKQLQKYGFRNITVVCSEVNENNFLIFKHAYPEFQFELVKQVDKRGMAGAVLSAEHLIDSKSVLIIKPIDLFEDILFEEFKRLLEKNKPEHILTGVTTNTYFPGGYLAIENERLLNIVEKPHPGQEPSNIVRIVFDYFQDISIFLKFLKESKTTKDELYEVALNNMINSGIKFYVLKYNGYWGFLQYPHHLLSVSSFFLSKLKGQKVANTKIAKSAIFKGDVYLGEGVQVLENSKIIGPTYIGKNTLVGNNVVVRESMIGDNCVLGFTTEITRSYVGNNSWFHTNYIGDSIIGDNVGLGAGAILANFRLDEKTISTTIANSKLDTNRTKLGAVVGKNVRIGVNSAIMPGVKIGSESFIGSGVVLDKDLPDHKAIFVKQDYIIKDNTQHVTKSSREKIKSVLKI